MRSIITKLLLGFLLIILVMGVIFAVAGIQLIGDRIVSEAQAKVSTDLNSAREIYLGRLKHIYDVVRFTADRFSVRRALWSGKIKLVAADRGVLRARDGSTQEVIDDLVRIQQREGLDILTITDASGVVLLRTSNLGVFGDEQAHDELVGAVLERKEPVASTSIVPAPDLRKESLALADRAYFRFLYTPMARARRDTEETAGMMLKAAAPIFDLRGGFLGVIYGGLLLNRNFDIVDKIKQTVFQNIKYKGADIGTATIFQDDVRVSTNVTNLDGSRAIGTRVAEDVYAQVAKGGKPYIGRAYVVNDWYITAYEPITNINNRMIGILYVGILEQRYLDIKRRTTLIFLAITVAGAVACTALSYFVSRRISVPIAKLVTASEEIGHGDLGVRVELTSQDELRKLADTFNVMASALQKRDEQLKEYTKKKIMESERLAILGQLAADVAHELNNPLQGIVAFSHLLLEKVGGQNSMGEPIQKIIIQAGRCRDIIRGLLDFARQREPSKKLTDVNSILLGCLSLVEGQVLFHNIEILKDCKEDLPPVVVDPSQIQQVFMNMMINAAEAMGGSGRLKVATRLDPADNFVEVEFTDSGHGVRPGDMERIFDPFFTTKDVGHGTGLGLAISYGIIKEHKGTVSVDSELGKGTTFTVRLPVEVPQGV